MFRQLDFQHIQYLPFVDKYFKSWEGLKDRQSSFKDSYTLNIFALYSYIP